MTGSLGFSPEYEPTVVGCRGYLKPLRGEGLSEEERFGYQASKENGPG